MNKLEKFMLNKIIGQAGLSYREKCLDQIKKGFDIEIKRAVRKHKDISEASMMAGVEKDFIEILKRLNINHDNIETQAKIALSESIKPPSAK